MLSDQQADFLASQRVGRLATADARGNPHIVPVCFAIADATLYVTIDEKPKRAASRPLKRLRNMMDNPSVAFVADRYDEDWRQLGWVMLRGRAEILADGLEHDRAQVLLRDRYTQYRTMQLAELPVIALRIERVTAWGNLAIIPADRRE
jgi:PPOX class probable F420-dependent enzyme